MKYTSYMPEVKSKMKLCKKEFLGAVGVWIVAEVQSLVPVLTGNLKRSIVFDVHSDNGGVDIGAKADAEYAAYVEKGTSKQKAQPYLEPGAMNTIPHLESIAQKYYQKLGG